MLDILQHSNVAATMQRYLEPPKKSRTDDQIRVFPARLGSIYYCCYEFNICGESPR